jgi:hypothetical protein
MKVFSLQTTTPTKASGGTFSDFVETPSPCSLKQRKLREGVVCGACGAEDVPVGQNMCPKHRRVVESMVSSYKAKDKTEGSRKGAEFADKRKKFKGQPPPNELSKEILDHEEKHPAMGRGVKRIKHEHVEQVEEQTNSINSKEGVKLVKMHQKQWLKHATEVMCYSTEWAANKWLDVKEVTAKDKWDYGGPPDSQLRLPMALEDYIDGYSQSTHAKTARSISKRLKLCDEKLVEAQADSEMDFKGFNNDMFRNTGGAALCAAATSGLSTSVNLRGQGAFRATDASKMAEIDKEFAKDAKAKKDEDMGVVVIVILVFLICIFP